MIIHMIDLISYVITTQQHQVDVGKNVGNR